MQAFADIEKITKLMRHQKRTWFLNYQKSIDPLPVKLAAADKYTLFRVQLFGGIIEIIAKSYRIKRVQVHTP